MILQQIFHLTKKAKTINNFVKTILQHNKMVIVVLRRYVNQSNNIQV